MKTLFKFLYEIFLTKKYQRLINWIIGVPCFVIDLYFLYIVHTCIKKTEKPNR